jgi:peroxiredoxin Q/BCP
MTTLKIGDPAPDFQSIDQDGRPVSLKDYRGHKLVLFFYPKAMTPGCTAEACNLRDNYRTLLDRGFKILGVSADTAKAQQKFISTHSLPFPLIPDTEKSVVMKYGVWGPKKFMGRSFEGINRATFVISEEGIIEKIFTRVETGDHAAQILKEYVD